MYSFIGTGLLLLGFAVQAEETKQSSCSLCLDGSSSPFPDRTVFDAFFVELPEGVKTCREVEEYLASDAADVPSDSRQCVDYLEGGALACGCPVIPYDEESSTCSLCIGGAEPAEDLLDFVLIPRSRGIPAVTCRDIHALASLPSSKGFNCDEIRWLGHKLCGCPKPSGDPLCSVGCDIPEENWEDTAMVRPWEVFPQSDWTCGDVDAFSRMTTSGEGCAIMTLVANAGCGCPTPEVQELGKEFTCPLCPNDDNLLPFGSTLSNKALKRGRTTCFNILMEAANEEGDICRATYLQDEAKDSCCNLGCKDSVREDMYVALREKGEVTNCAGVRASASDSEAQSVYCDSQGKVRRSCKETCDRCRRGADCSDANDSVTFPKMTVSFFTNFCRRLARKSSRKIAQICKDNPAVRSKCSKTCNPDNCGAE